MEWSLCTSMPPWDDVWLEPMLSFAALMVLVMLAAVVISIPW